jgi:hypothetical protein
LTRKLAQPATLFFCTLLAACGNKVDLKPRAGAPPPMVAAGSTKAETPKQQTTPDAEANPARSDELLRRSEERPTDEFDLPPPG